MFKQYFKQAIHALRENRLTSVVSILGAMLSVAMILVVVLQFQIKLVGYSPVSKRDRMLYIYSVNTKSKDGSENNNTGLSAETIRECLYTLKKPEAVTVTAQNSHVISIPGKRLFEEYTVYYTDPAFWKVFDFKFLSGKPFTEADFNSGLPHVHQARELNHKIVRIIRGSIAHQTRHVDIALGRSAAIDHPRVIGAGDHDEARAVRQVVMMRAHAMFKTMRARGARGIHGITAERVGKRKARARLQVIAVIDARRQCRGGTADAFAANHVTHGRVGVRHIALNAMEQGVESLIGRQARRNTHHKLGINDRKHREQARIAQTKLLVIVLAGQDTARIDLGAGTRRGGYANERQRIVGDRQAKRSAAIHKVPDVTGTFVTLGIGMRVGRHRADALAAVHD